MNKNNFENFPPTLSVVSHVILFSLFTTVCIFCVLMAQSGGARSQVHWVNDYLTFSHPRIQRSFKIS